MKGNQVYEARDVTDKKMIEKLSRLWKNSHRGSKYKTNPCRYGEKCTQQSCDFSHVVFNGISLLRCVACSRNDCNGRVMAKGFTGSGNTGHSVLTVCYGLVCDLENAVVSSAPPLAELIPPTVVVERTALPDPRKVEKSPPYDPSKPLESMEPEEKPSSKKRSRPDESVIYLVPTAETDVAIKKIACDPGFDGQKDIIAVPSSSIFRWLNKLNPAELLALAPQLKHVTGIEKFLVTARLMHENALLKQQLSDLQRRV